MTICQIYNKDQYKTRNATRCNNRDDFLRFWLHFENFNIFSGLYIIQSKIYDGSFIAKIISRYSQKSSTVDARLDSKYASAF